MSETIGPYEIRGELGRGAMAIVWRAWDPKLQREVAIKEPVVPQGTSPEMAVELARRFIREGLAAAALNHPAIVTIFDADVFGERPGIVMEIVEGEPLSLVLRRGPLPAGAATAILDQILDAAGYAHAHGIVHRDLKPDNIILTLDGRVKLADFGIAHIATEQALTRHGDMLGTPGYMAPEQIRGLQVDARADIFSIGVVGFELVSGYNPFTQGGPHVTAVMQRVIEDPLPSLAQLRPDVGGPYAASITVATAKDPRQRFGSAQEFRAALYGGPLPMQPSVPAMPQAAPPPVVPVPAPPRPAPSYPPPPPMSSPPGQPPVYGDLGGIVQPLAAQAPAQPRSQATLVVGVVAACLVVAAGLCAVTSGLTLGGGGGSTGGGSPGGSVVAGGADEAVRDFTLAVGGGDMAGAKAFSTGVVPDTTPDSFAEDLLPGGASLWAEGIAGGAAGIGEPVVDADGAKVDVAMSGSTVTYTVLKGSNGWRIVRVEYTTSTVVADPDVGSTKNVPRWPKGTVVKSTQQVQQVTRTSTYVNGVKQGDDTYTESGGYTQKTLTAKGTGAPSGAARISDLRIGKSVRDYEVVDPLSVVKSTYSQIFVTFDYDHRARGSNKVRAVWYNSSGVVYNAGHTSTNNADAVWYWQFRECFAGATPGKYVVVVEINGKPNAAKVITVR